MDLPRRVWRGCLIGAALAALPLQAAHAQHDTHVPSIRLGATGIGLWTLADPAFAGQTRSEGYFTQPYLLGHAELLGGRLATIASVNLEGFTLRRGELAAGNAGEGYVDRRHPHTFLHEAIATARGPGFGGFETSLSAGRGFAPFGTDDPMVRPFTKYPANHHLAQILERLVVIGAVRRGPVILEAGLFNGDEPTRPEDLGKIDRFGDSWAVRATVLPIPALELQASRASVESPEHVLGGGLDHRKWSASARFASNLSPALRLYGLLEWARTDEFSVGLNVYTFESALAEVAARKGPWEAALRVERTMRPEEERLLDPFRSARPHADENIMAVTRWTNVTARIDRTFGKRWVVEPFIEVSRLAVKQTQGLFFNPIEQYGTDRLWNLSLGARIGVGAQHIRMGRYGVALPAPTPMPVERAETATGASAHEHGKDDESNVESRKSKEHE